AESVNSTRSLNDVLVENKILNTPSGTFDNYFVAIFPADAEAVSKSAIIASFMNSYSQTYGLLTPFVLHTKTMGDVTVPPFMKLRNMSDLRLIDTTDADAFDNSIAIHERRITGNMSATGWNYLRIKEFVFL